MNKEELLAQRAIELEDGRPKVLVTGRYMRNVTEDCLLLLERANESDPRFFRLGDVLVVVADDGSDKVSTRTFTQALLKSVLERLANFVRIERDEERAARVPHDVIVDILALTNPPLPALEGVIQAPAYSPSGELDTRTGYQPTTGYYLHLAEGLVIPEVPAKPVAADIARARELLLTELLGDFPFVDHSDRAHALCVLLLPFIRRLIHGPTPLHLVESPTPGTGKNLLVDVLSIPAAGLGPSVMSEGRDEDEWRKRLTAKLVDSPQFILIDNVRSRLSSAALSAVLTATVWTDRLLGQSRMVTLPVNCVWIATANNPTLSLEVARRTVSTRIDSREERPWDRKVFRHPDLRCWALEHRGELIWATLTLINSWIAAGKPAGTGTLGSYESWASVMGGILEVGGIAGFLGNKDRVYNAAEQETLAWAEFCSEWWGEFQDRPVGTDLPFGLAYRHRLLVEVWGGRDDHSAHTRFGKALSKMKDRVVGEYRICPDERDSHNKGQRFHLENLRNVRNVAEPFAGPESRSHRNSDTAQRALLAVEATTLGRENPPQPSATPRTDPWDQFLDQEEHGTS